MFITSTFIVIRSRSLWHYFHAPVIVPYILNTISWINVILWILVLWRHKWHLNKCRSPWPIFHGPVILPYILNACSVYKTMKNSEQQQCRSWTDLNSSLLLENAINVVFSGGSNHLYLLRDKFEQWQVTFVLFYLLFFFLIFLLKVELDNSCRLSPIFL